MRYFQIFWSHTTAYFVLGILWQKTRRHRVNDGRLFKLSGHSSVHSSFHLAKGNDNTGKHNVQHSTVKAISLFTFQLCHSQWQEFVLQQQSNRQIATSDPIVLQEKFEPGKKPQVYSRIYPAAVYKARNQIRHIYAHEQLISRDSRMIQIEWDLVQLARTSTLLLMSDSHSASKE